MLGRQRGTLLTRGRSEVHRRIDHELALESYVEAGKAQAYPAERQMLETKGLCDASDHYLAGEWGKA